MEAVGPAPGYRKTADYRKVEQRNGSARRWYGLRRKKGKSHKKFVCNYRRSLGS